MPNILRIAVDNPSELLNSGAYGVGAVIRIQSAAQHDGPFADIAGTGATPTILLVAGEFAYTGYDPVGTSATWYRTRYESADASRASDWSDAFQVGSAAGIVGLADIRARLEIDETDHDDDGLLLDLIGETTDDIQDYCNRWFVPHPLVGTATYLFSPKHEGLTLDLPRGIRSLSALGIATIDQPDSGGVFSAVDLTQVSLQPSEMKRDAGWPATEVTLLETYGIPFYPGVNRVQLTGAFGFAAPPPAIVRIAKDVIIRRFVGKRSGVAQVVGASAMGGGAILRWVSPEDHETLYRYRAGNI